MHTKEEVVNVFTRIQEFGKIDENAWRSLGPHIRGYINFDRVYGGQTIGQSYLTSRNLFPDRFLSNLETHFLGPPTIHPPLDFLAVKLSEELSQISVHQNKKFVTKSYLKFVLSSSDLLDQISKDHQESLGAIKEPCFYMEVEEIMKLPEYKTFSDGIRGYIESICDLKLFEVRPINSNSKSYNPTGEKAIFSWCRLSPEIRDLSNIDPILVILLLSDWLLGEVLLPLYDQLKNGIYYTVASMNHKMWFHMSGFDPRGYFLHSVKCRAISKGHVLIEGKIYDENKKCIVTIVQDGFIQEEVKGKEELRNLAKFS